MDTTPFARNPYRGILTRVAMQFGFKGGRRSVFQAIKINRNPEVMMAVARAIRDVERELQGAMALPPASTDGTDQ